MRYTYPTYGVPQMLEVLATSFRTTSQGVLDGMGIIEGELRVARCSNKTCLQTNAHERSFALHSSAYSLKVIDLPGNIMINDRLLVQRNDVRGVFSHAENGWANKVNRFAERWQHEWSERSSDVVANRTELCLVQ